VDANNPWKGAQRFAFRFAFVYFAVYLATAPPVFTGPLRTALRAMVAPVYGAIFGNAEAVLNSGQSLGNDFSMALAALLLAMVIAPIWCTVSSRDQMDQLLHQWLRWAVRYFVLLTMVIYGVAKVIQFGAPPLSQMLQPIGSLTPMGVLWLFMGTSKMYSLFAGAAEVTGALLLLGRRTTTLGALVVLGVMTNVWLMNVLYDVPVRTLSLHLVLMSLFLLAPDLRRLADFFLLNRATAPLPLPIVVQDVRLRRAGNVLRALLVLGVFVFAGVLVSMAKQQQQRSPLYGAWFVQEFASAGTVRPPLVTDETRWRRVVFDFPQAMTLQRMDDSVERYSSQLNLEQKSLKLSQPGDKSWNAEFVVERSGEDVLTLTGTFAGEPVQATLRRVTLQDFPLASHNFR